MEFMSIKIYKAANHTDYFTAFGTLLAKFSHL